MPLDKHDQAHGTIPRPRRGPTSADASDSADASEASDEPATSPALPTHEPAPDPAWLHWRTAPFQLVLEGGAMRGMFTCGVLDFFLDHGLLAESVVGVSIGASCGFSYTSGVAGQTARMIMAYRSDWRFMSVRSKLRSGDYVGNEFIFDTIPYELEQIPTWLYARSPIQLVTVATNIDTGQPDYHVMAKNKGHVTEARYLMGSAALPCANRPVRVEGKSLFDGGIVRSVPFMYGRQQYRGRQVVVLTRPRGFRPNMNDPAIPLVRMRYPAHHALARAMAHRPQEYAEELSQVEDLHDSGELFCIWPKEPIRARMTESDPERLLAAYQQGLQAAVDAWPVLTAFLGVR
ncbi:MAG: patatin family protein [Atopobiaceae bacterium]